MNPCPSRACLEELLADQLSPNDEVSLEAHVSQCPDCQQTLEMLTAVTPPPALLRRALLPQPWAAAEAGPAEAADDARQRISATRFGGLALEPRPLAPPPLNLPGLEIYEELGHGGMGVVYRALQLALKRVVAVKVLRGGLGEQLVRFRAEAEAIARLQHPNIVQIYDVCLHGAVPFLTLEYVNGGSLAHAIRREPQPPRAAAELAEQLARAVQFAHDRGVLHRDLKPANVLLQRGATAAPASPSAWQSAIPKIADFGLAKIVDDRERLTQSHEMMGTPHYMAPEQVKQRPPSPAVDIWALGVILYELLTGRTPFEAESSFEVLQLVIHEEPLPASRLQRKLPIDLETICLKCLAKEPRQRYASAGELADDLGRFLRGEPIRARPIAAWQRLVKWTRRRPLLAGLLTLTLCVTLVALVSLGVAVVQARKSERLEADRRQQADEARDRETSLRRQAERLSARALLDVALGQCEKGAIDHGLHTFARVVGLAESLGDGDLDYAARVNLACWRRHYARPWGRLPHADWVWAVAVSPDGRWVATGSKDGTARVWNAATAEPVTAPLAHALPVWAVAFSPDSRTLLTGAGEARGAAHLWDAATGKPLGQPLEHQAGVRAVAFSPDGRTFLTMSAGQVQLWRTADRQQLGQPLRTQAVPNAAVFSPDGKAVLTAGRDGVARLWRADTGEPLETVFRHAGSVTAVAFSPNGQTVLTGCALGKKTAAPKEELSGEARLWDAATGRPLGPALTHRGPVLAVAFSPDGRLALTGGSANGTADDANIRGEARLWRAEPDDPQVGQPLGPVLAHPQPVWCLALSPSGQTVLTGAQDGHARLWSAADGQLVATLPRYGPFTLRQVAYTPDGRTIVTATAGQFAGQSALGQLWEAPPEQGLIALRGAADDVWAGDLASNGRLALTGHRQGSVTLWDVADGRRLGTLEHPGRPLFWAAFSPDSQSILTAVTSPNELVAWNPATGKRLRSPLAHDSWIRRIAVSPDGQTIASATESGKLLLWETASGKLRRTLDHPHPRSLCFSPDGRGLVSCSHEGTAQLWESATGRRLQTWTHPAACEGGNFSADGTLYLTGCEDGAARLWVVATGKLLGEPRSHASAVAATCFHSDGRSYLTGTEDGQVQRWDVALGKPLGPPLRFSRPIRGIAAAPNAAVLIRNQRSPTAYLLHTPIAVAGDAASIKLALQVLTGLKMDDDGAIHALSSAEWKSRRQQLVQNGDPFVAASALPKAH